MTGLPLTAVLIGAAALTGGTLAARHREHILAAGPILLLAGCALMHLFNASPRGSWLNRLLEAGN